VKNGEENIGEIELKSQIKAYSQKEWAFCFLWFGFEHITPQAGLQGGGHETRTRDTELEG